MNNGSWLPEEAFKGLSNHFFDDLIDHIDSPLEDFETVNDEGDWDAAGCQDLVPPPLDVLTSFFSEFTCKEQHVRVEKKHVAILKQSGVHSSPLDVKVSELFQSLSLVFVLEKNNGSVLSQNQKRIQRLAFSVKGIRSKRKHLTTPRFGFLQSFVLELSQQFVPDELGSGSYLCSENSTKKKRNKNKSHLLSHSVSYSPEVFNSDGTIRKCTHCETTKTPHWREGPKGPKTLCNACRVWFRSGRLVPEYRPASSPTFISTRHSNSHRKIVEMRRKGEYQFDNGMIHAMTSHA